MIAIVVPAHGTVALRDDGSVWVTDRSRTTYCLDPSIVRAIVDLAKAQHDDETKARPA